jgi:hypothetical protein
MPSMQRFLTLWLSLTGALILSVAAFNLLVDPYGLFQLIDRYGFNKIKPSAGVHGAMVKAYQVLDVKPHALILGNSRSEVGFNPENMVWPSVARPVYNLALPGTGTSTSLLYLQHVISGSNGSISSKPKIVVWGIDFMDFLIDGETPKSLMKPSHKGGRLLIEADGSRNAFRVVQKIRDYGESLLTLGAFFDSVQTLASQSNPYSPNLTPLGFNPMHDYIKITDDEGYWSVFRQNDIENVKAYLRRPKRIFYADGQHSSELNDVRNIINLCQNNGIALHIIIYPYHAHLLEIIRITGHWPAFEEWKRAITEIVASESHLQKTSSISLWDFSGFNEITTEKIPSKADRVSKMRWYWEAGHFKSTLGDIILTRVLGNSENNSDFGTLLTTANVEKRTASMRAEEIVYRNAHSSDIRELENIFAETAFHH